MTFYCVAPSCSYSAEPGSQYCPAHNGEKLTWYTVERDGRRVNVQAGSVAEAESRGGKVIA